MTYMPSGLNLVTAARRFSLDKPAHHVVGRLYQETGSRGAWSPAADWEFLREGYLLLLDESGRNTATAFRVGEKERNAMMPRRLRSIYIAPGCWAVRRFSGKRKRE